MSIIDSLLNLDQNKLKKDKKQFEVTRLSEIIGEKFVIDVMPITNKQVENILEIAGEKEKVAPYYIVESCRIEGKKFTDKELLECYKCVKGTDLVNKLMLPGEVDSIYACIMEMSGYKKGSVETVEEIKN